VEVAGVPNGKWPKFFAQDGGPALNCMEKKSPSGLSDYANMTFSHSILPVAPNSAKTQILTLFVTGNLKFLRGINAIVGSNALDFHIMTFGEGFKIELGLQ